MTEIIDTGADPLGDGLFKMYPSGDIVDCEERQRRLKRFHNKPDKTGKLIFGYTSREINRMQGRDFDLKEWLSHNLVTFY